MATGIHKNIKEQMKQMNNRELKRQWEHYHKLVHQLQQFEERIQKTKHESDKRTQKNVQANNQES